VIDKERDERRDHDDRNECDRGCGPATMALDDNWFDLTHVRAPMRLLCCIGFPHSHCEQTPKLALAAFRAGEARQRALDGTCTVPNADLRSSKPWSRLGSSRYFSPPVVLGFWQCTLER
jgi:hypothetical protein